MRKVKGRILSGILSLIMVLCSVPIQSFAQEQTYQDTVPVESLPGGGTEEVDVTITVKPKEDGTIETETKTETGGDRTDSGLHVEYEGKEQNKSTTDGEKGELISAESNYTVENDNGTYGASGGSTTTVSEGEAAGDITIEGLIEDGKPSETEVSGNTGAGVTTEVTGTKKEDDPANYDQTTTTTTDREGTAKIEEITVTTGDPAYDAPVEKSKEPSEKDGYPYYFSENQTVNNEKGTPSSAGTIKWQIKDADNNVVSSGEAGVCQRVVGYDDGKTPENRKDDPIISGLYCSDFSSLIDPAFGYRKSNLEDAVEEGYYTEEEAAHLRAILKNGYLWGTYDTEDVDESKTPNPPGTKNLEKIKAMMREKNLATEEEIQALTREQAATATNMAIWMYGNRVKAGQKLEMTTENKVVDTLANYLASLKDEKKETQIINEEKFVDRMDLIIGEKAEEEKYQVSVKFSLIVQPSQKDDLVVSVLDSAGKVVKTARISGDGSGDTFGTVKTERDAATGRTYYILDGLKLAQNSDAVFNLKMEGAQYLEEGVYVFQSQVLNSGGEKPQTSRSQNFIGAFSGIAQVNVGMQVRMNFRVKEPVVTTKHEWRKEWHHSKEIPPEEPKTPREEQPPKEPEPVAVSYSRVPKTGDGADFWQLTLALCGSSVLMLLLTVKKRYCV